MPNRALVVAFCLASTACASAPAAAPASRMARASGCTGLGGSLATGPTFSEPLQVVEVSPVHEVVGRQTTGAVRGAEVSVLAAPGYDRSTVHRILACRLATDTGAFGQARLSIGESGPGYRVRLTAQRREDGAAVWQAARGLGER